MTNFKNFLIILVLNVFQIYNLKALSLKDTFEFRVSAIHNLIKNEKWNCSDVVDYFIQRSVKYNQRLNAILAYNPKAFIQAKELDDFYFTNKTFKGKLHCVPVTIKDNIDVVGMPTTGGIKALRNSFPTKNAPVITRLLAEGAVIISKTNMGELAWGVDESEMAGQCKNPFDPKRSCGPSSIGSGAAIASGFAILSLGTDTDGSIQCPGSYNGIYGLRPPQNVPTVEGIIPSFYKQDTVGPFAKYMDDIALTYSIITNDSSIYDEYLKSFDNSNLKVGVVSNLVENFTLTDPASGMSLNYWLDGQVKDQVTQTIQKFKNLKINIFNYSLNLTELATMLMTFKINADSSHECMKACRKQSFNQYFNDPTRFESDSSVKSFDQLFQSPLLSQYWRTELSNSNVTNPTEYCTTKCATFDSSTTQFKSIISSWFDRDNVDCIIIPTRVQLPYIVGQAQPNTLPSFLSISAITGYPSLNIPVGYTKSEADSPDGLPIGMILIGRPDKLNNIFRIAKVFEKSYSVVKMPSSTPVEMVKTNSGAFTYVNFKFYTFMLFCVLICKLKF